MKERTLAMVKPNAVAKHVTGKIISMWEDNGFEVVQIKKVHLTRPQAAGFYREHEGKSFFDALVGFMTSGPIFILVLEKDNAIEDNRRLMGATDPSKAAEGTIRKLFADSLQENAVHGSDSPASAAREITYYFNVFETNP